MTTSATSPSGSIKTVDAEMLKLAMRLIADKRPGMVITEDMVGKTLFYQGEVFLADGPVPVLADAAA